MKPIKVSLWGDSIGKGIIFDELRGRYVICRDGCASRLARDGYIELENHCVMGQTSEHASSRLPEAKLTPGELVVFEYGGNDCDLDWRAVSEHPEDEQFGKVPMQRFEQNLTMLIEHTRRSGATPVLVTPPPLIAERYFAWVSRGLSKENILRYLGTVERIFTWQAGYAARVSALAKSLGVTLLDVRARLLECAQLPELFCIDGIHPNAEGHALIYDAILPLLS